ncbi:hypothetical protein LX64_03267 [Chitinophaga skermanii]|uniref:Uncharacterized protein n=1 Tax=Chitinophaga skermanii TaxID=331697 RepID=A0A327QEG1_9BACT|nr:hypothetical protein [Chitinophaga skermanii]RAJ02258.1 hypothetical protein LX64_03267 [Chitinophaga skermanii]
MSTIVLQLLGAWFIVFVPLAMIYLFSRSASEVDKDIKDTLANYGFKVLSIKATYKQFPYTPHDANINMAALEYQVAYKEVTFQTPRGKQSSLVAIEYEMYDKPILHFEVDYKQLAS